MGLWVQDQWDLKTLPLAIGLALFVAACAPVSPPARFTSIPLPSATLLPTAEPTATLLPATATPHPTVPPIFTPLPLSPTPGPRVCSPLEDVSLAEIPQLIAGNTYQTPQPGRDDGHPGIDLAYYLHGTRRTILGLPVHAAAAGRVAAVLPDRKPYGNLVIIETPLESIPVAWWTVLKWPVTPAPTLIPDARLTCPTPLETPQWNPSKRSLYLAYGHLNSLSPLHVGDRVLCGQPIGEVGTTGASVNPHLHFEARLGPAGAVFTSFGHYDTRTTPLERNNYCLWRVSSWFELVDPLQILKQQP